MARRRRGSTSTPSVWSAAPTSGSEVIDPLDGLPVRVVGRWTRRKHFYLDRYLDIFATGMSGSWPRRTYIDLFAGPGRCVEEGTGDVYDGSPLLAFRRRFTDHIYVELDHSSASALDQRSHAHRSPDRRVTVIQGDCNSVISSVMRLIPRGIVFTFLDPTNWQIQFETVRQLADVGRVDLLVSFFAGSMMRVAHLESQPRLDAFFGTGAWRTDHRFQGLDGRPTLSGLLACYREQLTTLGYVDRLSAREIPVKNSRNATMYLLAFFSKHQLGYRYWDEVTTEDEDGQQALPWPG